MAVSSTGGPGVGGAGGLTSAGSLPDGSRGGSAARPSFLRGSRGARVRFAGAAGVPAAAGDRLRPLVVALSRDLGGDLVGQIIPFMSSPTSA